MAAGQCLNVTLHSIQGDADLYIWQPNWTEEMDVLVANGTLPEDELTVPNAVAGQYQIEVEGFSDAAYSLAIVVGDVCNKGRAGQVGTERAAAKVTRARPWIALDSQPPAVNVATPDLPGAMSEGEFEIHLPLLNR